MLVRDLHTSRKENRFISGGLTFQRDLYLNCYGVLQAISVLSSFDLAEETKLVEQISRIREVIDATRDGWHPRLLGFSFISTE